MQPVREMFSNISKETLKCSHSLVTNPILRKAVKGNHAKEEVRRTAVLIILLFVTAKTLQLTPMSNGGDD